MSSMLFDVTIHALLDNYNAGKISLDKRQILRESSIS